MAISGPLTPPASPSGPALTFPRAHVALSPCTVSPTYRFSLDCLLRPLDSVSPSHSTHSACWARKWGLDGGFAGPCCQRPVLSLCPCPCKLAGWWGGSVALCCWLSEAQGNLQAVEELRGCRLPGGPFHPRAMVLRAGPAVMLPCRGSPARSSGLASGGGPGQCPSIHTQALLRRPVTLQLADGDWEHPQCPEPEGASQSGKCWGQAAPPSH